MTAADTDLTALEGLGTITPSTVVVKSFANAPGVVFTADDYYANGADYYQCTTGGTVGNYPQSFGFADFSGLGLEIGAT